jgi:hypothetical protein
MTIKRLRRLLATLGLILLVPGGASAAVAENEAMAKPATAPSQRDAPATKAAQQRQRRVEDAWVAEQLHAAAKTRASRD